MAGGINLHMSVEIHLQRTTLSGLMKQFGDFQTGQLTAIGADVAGVVVNNHAVMRAQVLSYQPIVRMLVIKGMIAATPSVEII